MATGKISNVGNYSLIYRGTFTGDINDTTIPPGIYMVGANTSYTHTDMDNGGITIPSYCPFLQLPYVSGQIFLTNPLIVRKCTGSPSRWRTYQFDQDKGYIEP